jgi:hypothetical protein
MCLPVRNVEGRFMSRNSVVLLALVVVVGCGPTPKEKYDEAVRDLERAQARLDNLLPAYQQATKAAADAVCKEIAGTTPEESANAALAGLGDVLNQAAVPPVADGKAPVDGEKPKGKKGDELDQTIDNLIAAQKDVQEKQAALTAPMAKANEVMAKIKTPGTPEAMKYEEKLKSMREAQAYERQQKRVESAQQLVDELNEEAEK